MSNTLTALTPTLFSAAQEVSNEPFGVIDSINVMFDDKGVAFGDVVKVPYAPVAAATDFTPANVPSAGTDKTASAVDVQIEALKKTSWNLTGEQIRSLQNANSDKEWVRQLVAQGMRTLRNLAESAAWNAARKGASRAVGTAGTTPFATTLDLLIDARKILQDNGAPLADLQFVMDTAAGAKLRKLGIIQQAYQAGTEEERRSGNFLRQFGFRMQESAAVTTATAGGMTGMDVNNGSGYVVGDNTIVSDGGTVNTTGVVAGDRLTWVGDTNIYIAASALVATTGNIVLNRPGLRATLADAVEMTVGATATCNLAMERSAVVGIMRPPIMPDNPTITKQLISDSKGMTYLLLEIAQYGQVSWELHLGYGFKAVQPEHIALVLG